MPRITRVLPALSIAAMLVVIPRTARAELRMKWDCYLPSSGLDCTILEESLTSKIPFLRSVDKAADADVVVTLDSVPAENSTRFTFDFVGKPIDGRPTEVHTTDKIPNSIDTTTATVRVMTKLERGLAEFMDQKLAPGVTDGKLSIDLYDPTTLPYLGRPEQGVKWFVAPAVGAYASSVEGVGVNASGSASITFNQSEKMWRVQQSIGATYNRESQPVAGTDETASVSFAGAYTADVLSVALTNTNRWNLGLLVAAEKNPQANYTMHANASAGIEYDLIPRQTVNQRNFGFRWAIGPELQRYDATNIEGLDQQLVGRQFCDVFFSWHFAPVDLSATVSETTVLKSLDYRSFAATLSATWRVTDNLTITPYLTLQQIEKATNEAEPSNVVYADPKEEIEASLLAAVRQGYTAPFSVQASLYIRYYFGNGSLSIEDQRWKGASNLR